MKPEDVTSEMVSAADFAIGVMPGWVRSSAAQLREAIAAAINAMPPDPELERLRAENERLRTNRSER